MKRFSTSLIIREMQIKTANEALPHTTQNGHCKKQNKTKKNNYNKCWRVCRKGNPPTWLGI